MRKPNLLFLYTDEQAYYTMAAYGNNRIQTPCLNALSESCAVFEQAYVTQPVCTPSRSTLLTGQWPHTNGCTENNIPLKTDTLCFPEMLDDPEYVTAHFGKWHLGDEIFAQHGFEHWSAIEDGYRKYYADHRSQDARSEYHHFLRRNGFEPNNGTAFGRAETARYPEEYGKPAFLAQRTETFLKEHRDDPFILYVNFLEPHMPYFGPRDNQHDLNEIPLPENFNNPPTSDQPLKTRAYRYAYAETGHSGLPLKTEADWKRLITNYWGLVSLVDTYVGRIVDTLRELDLFDDTIIVFTSDHGDMMGSHRLTAKCVMFEEAVRVPLLIKAAGANTGKRVPGPVSHIDVVPTLLDLMGGGRHEQCQGRSLAEAVVSDDAGTVGSDVVIEWQGPNSGVVWEGAREGPTVPAAMNRELDPRTLGRHILDPVRTLITSDGWKFSLSTLGEHELYNLFDDPNEITNLAATSGHAKLVGMFTERIRSWQVENRDPAPMDPTFANPEGW